MSTASPEPPDDAPVSHYPPKLNAIIELFESLPEEEKRENLIAYSEQAKKHEPREGETFDLEDIRKDEECTDTVGVFVRLDAEKKAHFRITLGPQVQTLTKAMTSILSKGLDGLSLREIMDLPADFVPRIVGGHLVRIRSQTVYYILTRIKSACQVLINRLRAGGSLTERNKPQRHRGHREERGTEFCRSLLLSVPSVSLCPLCLCG